MSSGTIVIFTAVLTEADAIARSLRLLRSQWSRSTYRGHDIELHVIGIGARHVPNLSSKSPSVIIMAGFGGGLSPDLKIGEVVIDLPKEFAPLPPGPWRAGRIHCSTTMLTTPADKRALFASTGADVVEMETAGLRSLGVPIINIRAVSDTADQSLDPAVLKWVDPFGRPRWASLLLGLLSHPTLMPHLLRLGRASSIAGAALGRSVASLLSSNVFASSDAGV